MGEPKFTKNMKSFCDKQADGKFNIGIEDSENTVLCYTASGNPETRRANVTLWSKSDELYKMLEKLLIAAKTANEMNPIKIHQGLLRDAEETLKEARGEE